MARDKRHVALHGDEIPIHPKDYLYLCTDCPTKNKQAHRSARLFANVWKQLPRKARRSMLDCWWYHEWAIEGELCPEISLLYSRSEDWTNGNSGNAGAQMNTDYLGAPVMLRFKGGAMERMPNWAVEVVIAHELAHCFCFINYTPEDRIGDFLYWCEVDALELLDQWGFDTARYEQRYGIPLPVVSG